MGTGFDSMPTRVVTPRGDGSRSDSSIGGCRVLVYAEAWGFGGIESYLMGLFRQLSGRGFSFALFSVWDWNDSFDPELSRLGVERYVVFRGRRPGISERLRGGLAAFDRLLRGGGFDAVHICAMNGTGFAYARAAERRGVPVRVVHSHNSDVGEGHKAAKRAAHAVLLFLLSGSETARVACSREAGEHLFGGAGFTVVHNGFDTVHFAFDPVARKVCRDELGVPGDALLLGNPSRLAPAKNPFFQLDVFSEALKFEPSSWYLMQGCGEMEGRVREHADELGVEERVVWFEPRPDASALYSAMDAMLFPSLFEGLSLATVEAQASGLSVVTSDAVSSETGVTGLIRYLSLDEPASLWARELLVAARGGADRSGFSSEVRAAGYDVADTSKTMSRIYRGDMQ